MKNFHKELLEALYQLMNEMEMMNFKECLLFKLNFVFMSEQCCLNNYFTTLMDSLDIDKIIFLKFIIFMLFCMVLSLHYLFFKYYYFLIFRYLRFLIHEQVLHRTLCLKNSYENSYEFNFFVNILL